MKYLAEDKKHKVPYFTSATEIKNLSYQAQRDILIVELIGGGIKESLKVFPQEFKNLKPDYSLELSKDCKWDNSKLKGTGTPLSCRKEKNGEFMDISLEKNSKLRIPEFIIS
ncbi:hypothetical protein DNK47_01420 [Mycoplasma wenyonii]|uniref:Uncharacterized protein n=1 Tax=Mycoplasma wenyonii TaxID=65123 RepID=A0A328PJX2_9MOLU|nr:hypothetical protein [Mycoplasma wenyonii]RAO95132.1 hypothetical protein DNK47_01420 [Mycoplasma wenyonii]